MDQKQIRLLFDYHYWALERLIDGLLSLPSEKMLVVSSHFYHETAFRTVLHTLDVDWSWLERCKGVEGTAYLWEVEELPDMESMLRYLQLEKERVDHYLQGLSEADLQAKVAYGGRQLQQTRRQILLHIVNHGTEHRTELGHFLTECGASPGELGLFSYLVAVQG